MTQTVLLTIGRLPKALDFARAFHHAGWRVLVAEPFATHLTGASNCVAQSFVVPAPKKGKQAYLAALAALVVEQQVDLVLPLSEETMHVAHLRPLLPSHVSLYAPDPASLLRLHDKHAFIQYAGGLGLSVPETADLASPQAHAIAQAHDYVIKPVFSCSGRGVTLCPRRAALPDISSERMIVQRCVRGASVSTFAIMHEGAILCHVAYRGLVMSGSVAVAFERVEEAAVAAWVRDFAMASGHTGFASFDFIVDAAGRPYAIECNPRVTSGLHFLDPRDLVSAITQPGSQPVRPRADSRLMQFYPTLTEVQASFGRKTFVSNLKHMLSARDVTWSLADPMPFLTMPITAFGIIAAAISEKKSFGEVSTDDIAWYE